jgi:hypothetical protein
MKNNSCANCDNTMPIASIVAVPIPCANTLYRRYRVIGIGTGGRIAQSGVSIGTGEKEGEAEAVSVVHTNSGHGAYSPGKESFA